MMPLAVWQPDRPATLELPLVSCAFKYLDKYNHINFKFMGAARITNYKAILSQLSAVFPLTIPKPNDHRHVHAFI